MPLFARPNNYFPQPPVNWLPPSCWHPDLYKPCSVSSSKGLMTLTSIVAIEPVEHAHPKYLSILIPYSWLFPVAAWWLQT